MEVVHISGLLEWRKKHPDIKTVMVDHAPFSKAIYTFDYVNPLDIPWWGKVGMYDGFGNFHFIDEEGTYHKCLSNRRYQ